MSKRKRTNNDLQNTQQKTKDQATRTQLIIYLLALKIKEGEGWDPINWFNPATLLCLSQATIYDVKANLTKNVCLFMYWH